MLNDMCRCHGIDFDVNGLVSICPERTTCERYLQRATGELQADGLCGVFEGEFNAKIQSFREASK